MVQERRYIRSSGWIEALVAVMMLVLAVSCREDTGRGGSAGLKDFVEKQDAGLFGYGGFLFRYSEGNCQLSFNRQRRQIRLQDDQQAGYLNVIFEKFPAPGENEASVEMRYKAGGDEIIYADKMGVVRVAEDKIWLWDAKDNLGVILPICW
ncbi:MAG: hypothetical protein IJ383_05515 [Bacteroidales bacterium]|nr:hypothetical protein [Bacteroidales bacterium]